MKKCSRCKVLKEKSNFNKNRSKPDGLQDSCKECQLAYQREHPETARKKDKKVRQRNKSLCLEYFGKVCYCCGESNPAFLTIGHKNHDGALHKRTLGGVSGTGFYRILVRDNFITDFELRVECYNCNCGARCNNNICPHKAYEEEK